MTFTSMLGWRVGSTAQYALIVISLASFNSVPRSFWLVLCRPLHFQPQQTRLRTTDRFCGFSILSVERIAALIESIDLGPALGFIV